MFVQIRCTNCSRTEKQTASMEFVLIRQQTVLKQANQHGVEDPACPVQVVRGKSDLKTHQL